MVTAPQMLQLLGAVMAQRSANAAKIQAAEIAAEQANNVLQFKALKHREDLAVSIAETGVKAGRLVVEQDRLKLDTEKQDQEWMVTSLKSDNPVIRANALARLVPKMDKGSEEYKNLLNTGRTKFTTADGHTTWLTIEQLTKAFALGDNVTKSTDKLVNSLLANHKSELAAKIKAGNIFRYQKHLIPEGVTQKELTEKYAAIFKPLSKMVEFKDNKGVVHSVSVQTLVNDPDFAAKVVLSKAIARDTLLGKATAVRSIMGDKGEGLKIDVNGEKITKIESNFLVLAAVSPKSVVAQLKGVEALFKADTPEAFIEGLGVLKSMGFFQNKSPEDLEQMAANRYVSMKVTQPNGTQKDVVLSIKDVGSQLLKSYLATQKGKEVTNFFVKNEAMLERSGVNPLIIRAGKTGSEQIQASIRVLINDRNENKRTLLNSLVALAGRAQYRDQVDKFVDEAAVLAGVNLNDTKLPLFKRIANFLFNEPDVGGVTTPGGGATPTEGAVDMHKVFNRAYNKMTQPPVPPGEDD